MKGKYLLPVLIMLTGAQATSVCARELIVRPGHWQRDMAVGVAEFKGTLYMRNTAWLWQPQPLLLAGTANSYHFTTKEMQYGTPGSQYTVLAGHTSGLMTAKPGLQPSVTLSQTDATPSRTAIWGEVAGGQVRYGEITFKVRNVLAYQDKSMARRGFSIAGNEALAPDVRQQVIRQLWQVQGYQYRAEPASNRINSDLFTRSPDRAMVNAGDGTDIAGAWLTMLEDVKVRFPAADAPVKRWQGNLTPVVMYF